ncbi:MAG: hypothetical protein ACT4QE_22420 [Anaerolineales bacterium]
MSLSRLTLLITGVWLAACAPLAATPTATPPLTPTVAPPTATPVPLAPTPTLRPSELSSAEAQALIEGRATEVLRAIKSKDFAQLAGLVHPTLGVRFTPYGYVSDTDLVFRADQLPPLAIDATLYTWGAFDGSGEPITLTFSDYLDRFVYSQDFIAAPQIGYNESVGQGNTIDNWREFYPDGLMVEYHFPGFDPQYGGLDWQSLRLIFQRDGEIWYLVGLIHAQWTI